MLSDAERVSLSQHIIHDEVFGPKDASLIKDPTVISK